MVPSRKFGVVVLANRSSVSLTRTANAAIEAAFTLEPVPAGAPRVVLTMTPAEAARIAGVYSQGARRIELVAHDAALFVIVAGRETAVEKVAENELMIGTARYVIVRGPSGAVEYLHTGGRSWSRVQSPAQPSQELRRPSY
jgi:hypothetical protein